MNPRLLSALAAVALFCCGLADAQAPRKLNYQGFLTSPTGAPVDASVQMVFTIYPAATGPASATSRYALLKPAPMINTSVVCSPSSRGYAGI